MNLDVRHNPFPAVVKIPLDTDAIHPQSLVAAFTIAVERMESEAERRKQAMDWASLTFALEPHRTEDGTTYMKIMAKRFM